MTAPMPARSSAAAGREDRRRHDHVGAVGGGRQHLLRRHRDQRGDARRRRRHRARRGRGGLTFDGGTLRTTASFAMSRRHGDPRCRRRHFDTDGRHGADRERRARRRRRADQDRRGHAGAHGANTYGGGTQMTRGAVCRSSADASLGAAAGRSASTAARCARIAGFTTARATTLGGGRRQLRDRRRDRARPRRRHRRPGRADEDRRRRHGADRRGHPRRRHDDRRRQLQLGDGGTTGSLAGDVPNDAALVFDRSNALDVGGVISGTGTVVQAGDRHHTPRRHQRLFRRDDGRGRRALLNGDQAGATGATTAEAGLDPRRHRHDRRRRDHRRRRDAGAGRVGDAPGR